jgi:hypothetical protein
MVTAPEARQTQHHLFDSRNRGFQVAFTLGKKAVNAAMASDLPDSTKQLINDSPVYPEGTGVRFAVCSQKGYCRRPETSESQAGKLSGEPIKMRGRDPALRGPCPRD